MSVLEWRHEVRPHLYQLATLDSVAPTTIMIAGVRGGKTTIGSTWSLDRLGEMGKGEIFLMTAPDFPMLSRVVIPTILHGSGVTKFGQWPTCPGCEQVICPKKCPVQESFIAEHRVGERTLITRFKEIRIMYLTGEDPDKVRGIAPHFAWIDEITLCRKELYQNVLGRLIDFQGRLLLTGTPKMKSWFRQEILDVVKEEPFTIDSRTCGCEGKVTLVENDLPETCRDCEQPFVEAEPVTLHDRWYRNEDIEMFRFPTSANPGIDERALARIARNYPGRLVEQEIGGKFVAGDDAMFDHDAINRGRQLGSPHWQKYVEGHRYSVGLDPAGRGKDWWAVIVICLTCRGVVDLWRQQKITMYRPLYNKAAEICCTYHADHMMVDQTAMGDPILEELQNAVVARQRDLQFKRITHVEGYPFSKRSKYELLTYAAARLEEDIGLPTNEEGQPLSSELRNYALEDDELVTDCVMAFALACWQQVMPKEKATYVHVPGRNLRPERRRLIRDWRTG